jgi:restriction endonuclease S subunit
MEKIKLKKVLKNYKIKHIIQNDRTYRQVTISQTGEVSFRGEKHGADIGRKRQFMIDLKNHPNTLIFIRQGIMKGGIGVCPPEVDGCVVTENMPMFDIVDINPDYLLNFIKSPQFKEDVSKLVPIGTAQKALHENKLLEVEIPYLSKNKQEEIVKKIQSIEKEIKQLEKNVSYDGKLLTSLRQSILQEAVQGKLVPQDPKDTPAYELLKKIKAEKEKLIKEGKIKKGKDLPPIEEDEVPYRLPKGWEWCRLGGLVSILGDGIHGTPNYTKNGECFFVNGNNLNKGKIAIKENTKRVSEEECEKYKKELNDRTILVSINGTLGNVAFYNNEKIMLGKSACYFNLLNELDKNYIKLLIETNYFLDYCSRNATGSTIKNVSLNSMRLFPIPLPPLPEQKRIVEKVDALMKMCDNLELKIKENKINSENLMGAVLKESFEERKIINS